MPSLALVLATVMFLTSSCSGAPAMPATGLSSLNNTHDIAFLDNTTGIAVPVNSTTLSIASPPQSHIRAAAAGIDIYGEIPNDYVHKDGSACFVLEGSNASIWVHAQLDIPPVQGPQKRQVSTQQSSSVQSPLHHSITLSHHSEPHTPSPLPLTVTSNH